MNLYHLLADTAQRQPRHPAVLSPESRDCRTYAQLHDAILTLGDVLRRAGLRPGDCVGLHYPSGADYIALTYAVWKTGGCAVPVPVELTPPEKQQLSRDIALDFVISQPQSASFAASRGTAIELSPRAVLVPTARRRDHPPGFHDTGAAFIRFTSGTTGDSRGVVLSHESVHERIRAAQDVLGIAPEDRVLWLLSMSYHFTVSIVAYLSYGATVVLTAGGFAREMLHAARSHAATVIYGSPVHYGRMAEAGEPASLASLRLAISTATGLARETAERFHRRFGLPVTQALGIIEIGLPAINLDFAADRPEAVGRVLPAYRLRMVDVGLGEGLKEIQFSGPGFLDAYYEPWRPRSAILADGWFRTGDVGELDDDGCLFIRGRTGEVINVAGMKFFPQEVESVLASHPGVKEACVLSDVDPRFGELPRALVVAPPAQRPSVRELIEHCKRSLSPFKIPTRIDFVDSLDRTASGKVLHRTAGIVRKD
jgi:long-chain acyl-CoA synthetase